MVLIKTRAFQRAHMLYISYSSHQKIKFIPTKIHKTVATRVAPFGPDMHQIVCRLGVHPRLHWGAYSAPPDSLAGLRGPTSKGGKGKGGKGSYF